MTHDDARDKLADLVARVKAGTHLIGVLTVDDTGAIDVTMSSDDDVDALRITVQGQLKGGGMTVDVPLSDTPPTLEEI